MLQWTSASERRFERLGALHDARVLVAHRDRDRAQAVATANGAEALSLAEVPAALERAHLVRT